MIVDAALLALSWVVALVRWARGHLWLLFMVAGTLLLLERECERRRPRPPVPAPAAPAPPLRLVPCQPPPQLEEIVQPDVLLVAVMRSAPHLDEPAAAAHVAAARAAATPAVTAELLLAIAWAESRYVATGVSRIECTDEGCRRVRGNWPRRFPARFRPPYFCGYLGQKARTEAACRARSADIGRDYVEAAAHLDGWLRFCRVDRTARQHRDRVTCALAGYNGGVAAARELRRRYATGVLSRARRLGNGWHARPGRPPSA